MNTALAATIGLVAFVLAVALAPLVARTIQQNGLIGAINSIGGSIERFAPDTGANIVPGLIYASNEARFTASNYSEPLTAYTVGWKDPENMEALLELLFPSVMVGRRFEFKSANNADAFLTEDDDERTIGATFKRVETKGTSVNAKTINRGLTTRVDKDDTIGADWKQAKVSWLMQRLLRNEFKRSLALLDAAATNVAKTWNAASNPDGDIRAMLKLGADASGIRPNRLIYGEAAMDLRLDVYEAQDTPYAGRAASMSKAELAAKYMVDLVEVIKARYQSTASAKAAIVPSVVYGYLAFVGASKDDPSNYKRFVSPTDKGTRMAVYIEEFPKFVDISVEHYSAPTITSTLGIRKITASS